MIAEPVTPDGHGHDRGFGLLDAIVALALVSLTIAALSPAYPLAARAVLRADATGRSLEDFRALAFVGDVVRGARPITSNARDRSGEVLFTGSETRLAVVADMANAGSVGGPHDITLQIEPAPALAGDLASDVARGLAGDLTSDRAPLQRIVMARRLYARQAGLETFVLLGQVRQARFQYFGRLPDSRPDHASVWQPTWEHRDRLPDLVMIEAQFLDGRGMQRLVVRSEQRR
jgi:type II secretory pathway component PulJ